MRIMDEYDTNIFFATLCERAERHEDMIIYMKKAIEYALRESRPLDFKAHNLLSVAFKNHVGSRRSSWRVLCAERTKYEAKDTERPQLVDIQIGIVENELSKICNEALSIINDSILSREDIKNNRESNIFFLKMVGDYNRYKAEVEKGEDLKKSTQEAKNAYDKAYEEALKLPATSPIRLGLALNYSVFYYEILKLTNEACKLAKDSFDGAVNDLEKLSEEHYKDSTLIMQLLRDNLTLWTVKTEENEDEHGEKIFTNEDSNEK